MRTYLNIARYHLVMPLITVGLPWIILAFSFLVNLVIFRYTPVSHNGAGQAASSSHHYTGGVASLYVFVLIIGLVTIGRSLPFGLALGVSRRSYYIGTALFGVAFSAVTGLALTGLQAIERATGGWGEDMHFFRVPYILSGPWYLTLLTSFVALALVFIYGMWYGIVFRRWNLLGIVAFIAAQVTVLVAAGLVITWTHAWSGTGRFFTALSAVGLTGILAALVALLLTGGYATLRRATV